MSGVNLTPSRPVHNLSQFGGGVFFVFIFESWNLNQKSEDQYIAPSMANVNINGQGQFDPLLANPPFQSIFYKIWYVATLFSFVVR